MKPHVLFAWSLALLHTISGVTLGQQRRVPLLDVSSGKLPNDAVLEQQTKLTIVDAPRELGGKALKVVFAEENV